MTYSRDTKAISEFTGEPISTWSEEWRVETEARTGRQNGADILLTHPIQTTNGHNSAKILHE
jgi:hypothetical protein